MERVNAVSFKEKSTIVLLAVFVIVYGAYFAVVLTEASSTPVDEIEYQGLLIGMVIVLVVLIAAGHIVIAIASPEEADLEDERDKLIELRGDRAGGIVVTIGALGGLALAMGEAEWFWIAQVLLAGIVGGEVVKFTLMLVTYRRAA